MLISLTGKEPLIRSIANAAFPGYKGKKFTLETSETVDVRSYWDGGSRDYFAFVRVESDQVVKGFTVPAQSAFDRPIQGADSVRLDSVPGLVCVRHAIFCGKDMGLTIIIHPSMMNQNLLPMTTNVDLSADESRVLYCTRAYKSSYAGVSRQQQSRLSVDAWNAAKASLIGKGLLAKNGALTVNGRNVARNIGSDGKEYDF